MFSEIEFPDPAGPTLCSVTRCEHGCFHVNVGRCSVTLSPEEFHLLRELIERAALGAHLQADGRPIH